MDLPVHKPVLLNEVLAIFNPQPGQIYIDATVNGGGHARAIAELVGPRGKVIGIDWDCELLKKSPIANHQSPIENIELVCDTYINLKEVVVKRGIVKKVDGILFDFGFSSYHLEQSGRGFSFLRDEPLDMRYNLHHDFTAAHIVNQWSRDAIADVLCAYGEERFAQRIATAVVRRRVAKRIASTVELADIVARSIPRHARRSVVHPATRTFQALRIAVNNELENITHGLSAAVAVVKKGGIIAAISFHSLEDRLVKSWAGAGKRQGALEIITKKPIRPQREEMAENPRARSAKLRAVQCI